MNNRLSPALPLEIKRADVDAEGVFTGLASTFDNIDSYGDRIHRGAFDPALRKHKRAGTRPALLWAHDHKQPIGRWIDLEETKEGLLATGKLTLAVPRAREAHALLKDQAVALSIGFTVSKTGVSNAGGVREIKEINRLAEVSLVSMPANDKAKIISTRARPTTPRQYEKLLREVAGYSNLESKRLCAAGFAALSRDEQGTDLDQVFNEVRAIHELLRAR